MWKRYLFLSVLLSNFMLGSWHSARALTGVLDPSLAITGVQCINVSGLPIASTPALVDMNRFDCNALMPTIGTPLAMVITGSATSNIVQGEVDASLSLTSVTCTNVTNPAFGGMSDVALLVGQTFRCPELLIEPGDMLAMTLAGLTLAGSGNCVTVADVETEIPQEVPVLTFNGVAGECATITGTISDGFDDLNNPDPNQDFDLYVLLFPFVGSLTQAEVSMSIASDPPTDIGYALADGQGNILLDCSLTPTLCQGVLDIPGAILVVAARDPTAYTLNITASMSGGRRSVDAEPRASTDVFKLEALRTRLPKPLLNAIP